MSSSSSPAPNRFGAFLVWWKLRPLRAKITFVSVSVLLVLFAIGVAFAQPEQPKAPAPSLSVSPSLSPFPSISPSPSPSPTPSPTIKKFGVPSVVGLDQAKAKDRLRNNGFSWTITRKITSEVEAGTVISQSIKAGKRRPLGTVIALTVAKAPPPPPPAPSPPPPPPPAPNCDPNYSGACLTPGIGDYDCGGGSGNGPNYVWVTVRVVGYDVYGLDGDNDGYGCE
jgi:hypothetical protein